MSKQKQTTLSCLDRGLSQFCPQQARKKLTSEQVAKSKLRACLHGGGGPRVGEVTRLGGVTRLPI